MTTPSLPMDIMGNILSYCHAKTIHTFLFTAIASHKERSKVLQVVRSVLQQRFLLVSKYLDRIPNYMPRLMSPYITQYATVLSHEHLSDLPIAIIPADAVSFLSSRVAVLYYFEQAQETQTIHDGAHEWLAWTGTLELTYIKGEVKANTRYRAQSKVVRRVNVEMTSPCWYPSLISKWNTTMQQNNGSFGTDFSRQYRAGNQHGRNHWTHVARILQLSKHGGGAQEQILVEFNRNRRHGDYANPNRERPQDAHGSLIRPFLTSPRDAYNSKLVYSSTICSSGNVKASIVGPTTTTRTLTCDAALFAFWHDMDQMDRERSFDDFTNDVVQMLSKRLHMTRNDGGGKMPAG